MVRPLFFIILGIVIVFSYTDARALSDEDHNRFLNDSSAYALADGRLNEVWRGLKAKLTKEEYSSLLEEQRAWVKDGRDRQAAELGGGRADAEAYAAAIMLRVDVLQKRYGLEPAQPPALIRELDAASGQAAALPQNVAPAGGESSAREEDLRARLEAQRQAAAEQQAQLEARLRAATEQQARLEARLRAEAEDQAQLDAQRLAEAEQQAQRQAADEEQARLEAQIRAEAEEQARLEARLRAEAERQVQLEAETTQQAQLEAEDQAQPRAEAITRAETAGPGQEPQMQSRTARRSIVYGLTMLSAALLMFGATFLVYRKLA